MRELSDIREDAEGVLKGVYDVTGSIPEGESLGAVLAQDCLDLLTKITNMQDELDDLHFVLERGSVNTDEVLDYRRLLLQHTIATEVPESIVYATDEWTEAVQQMADQIPAHDPGLTFPTEAEVDWAWGETGVLVVFETPITLQHIIVSDEGAGVDFHLIDPIYQTTDVVAVIFSSTAPMRYNPAASAHYAPNHPARIAAAEKWEPGEIVGTGIRATYLGPPESKVIDGRVLNYIPLSYSQPAWGIQVAANPTLGLSQSTRTVYSMMWALGHKMTTSRAMAPTNNYARKRLARSGLPPIRMLTLTGPSEADTDGERVVNWKRSWKVRTHWRNQACGPKMRQHKKILIHSYWKQDHLPPDLRPTMWKAE